MHEHTLYVGLGGAGPHNAFPDDMAPGSSTHQHDQVHTCKPMSMCAISIGLTIVNHHSTCSTAYTIRYSSRHASFIPRWATSKTILNPLLVIILSIQKEWLPRLLTSDL